jgi:DNA-directed RNA polymerase
VGDFDPAAMKKQVTRMFSEWQGKGKQVAYGKPSILQNNQVLLVDKPDARETTFLIGGPGVARDNPDYVALQVVNTILGGRFTSWLNDELRVNSGLTYGARSYFDVEKQAGLFKISTFTQTENTEKAIDLALKVYQRLLKEGIDQETLESAKNYLKGQLPPKYERGRSLANYLTGMYLYGYDASYLNQFVQKVNELDLEKAREIVETYFPAENELVFILIGKADELKDLAGKYGKVTEKTISAEGF